MSDFTEKIKADNAHSPEFVQAYRSAVELERYLTDEVRERAARAIYESERMATPWRDIPDEDQSWFAGQARAALAAVLPGIIRQAKAEAREAILGQVPEIIRHSAVDPE